jgi:hypothetical protein
MEYYLLPVEENEAIAVEEVLKKIDYDVDDRASTWTKEDIDRITNAMTKENAQRLILEFLPEPVGEKFADLYGIKSDQPS